MLEVEYPDMLDEIPEDRSDEVGPSWEEKIVRNCKCQPFQPWSNNSFPKSWPNFHDFCVGSHDAYQDRGVGTVGQDLGPKLCGAVQLFRCGRMPQGSAPSKGRLFHPMHDGTAAGSRDVPWDRMS